MRHRRKVAGFSVLALIASLLAILTAAPSASAATVITPAACTNTFAPTTLFNLPVNVTTTATPTTVEAGASFDVEVQASVPLSEAFIAGVVAVAPITDLVVNSIKIEIPIPANATSASPNMNLTWSPGATTIATEGPVGVFTPVPGGVTFTSPAVTHTLTATAPGSVDFFLNQRASTPGAGVTDAWTVNNAPIEMNLTILGVVKVGFDCVDGAYAQNPGPDTILGTGDDFFELPLTPSTTPWLSVPISAPLVPTVNVSGVTGQVVTTAARAGNTISFGGPNWSASSAITVELCDLALTSCSASELTAVSASITGGTLSGTATVAGGATTGARALKIGTDQSESDDVQVLILGTPTIAAPGNAGLGAPITISGTNWNPGSTSTVVAFTTALGAPVAAPFPVTVDNTGEFTTTQNVVTGMEVVGATETGLGYPAFPAAGSLFAGSPFTVSANSCTVPTGGSCTIQQTVLLTTNPGTLSMSQQSGIIDLGNFDLDGTAHHVLGDINQITTVDATGSLSGWDLTATMTDLITDGGGGNKTIPASNMQWAPSCNPIDANSDGIIDGNGAEVSSGVAAALDTTVARTLCTAAAGGGGGTFTGDASLDLFVPANVAAGAYQATITFLLM